MGIPPVRPPRGSLRRGLRLRARSFGRALRQHGTACGGLVLLGIGLAIADGDWIAALVERESAPRATDARGRSAADWFPRTDGGASAIAPEPDRDPEFFERNFIAAAVQRVGPSVARIQSDRPGDRRGFFGDSDDRATAGTAFALDDRGHLVASAHLVEGDRRVRVELSDGREVEGRVLGVDALTDLAVVKIPPGLLPAAPLGDAAPLQPGDWVIAIGNPPGLDRTATAGIVSATGRSHQEVGARDRRVELIQTDAALNPGSAGGPLLDVRGNVVGVNVAALRDAQGLNFAVPINRARRIAAQLAARGRVEHPYLGLTLVALNPSPSGDSANSLRERLNAELDLPAPISEDRGLAIVAVAEDSPAAIAGLQPGDTLVALSVALAEPDPNRPRDLARPDLDAAPPPEAVPPEEPPPSPEDAFAAALETLQPVFQPQAVREAMEAVGPGQPLLLRVQRGGNPLTVQVVLGTLPDPKAR